MPIHRRFSTSASDDNKRVQEKVDNAREAAGILKAEFQMRDLRAKAATDKEEEEEEEEEDKIF
jgi:hypothetical protein